MLLNGGVIAIVMANKIVQLIDDNNDNLYPVAGSLKSGSVTTSTINDGAVTSSKIDFTTIDWASGATIGNYNGTPVKIKTVSGNISSTINNWNNIGSIGSGHTILGAFGAFMEGTTGYPFPGTSASENNVIYIDSSGSVFVKSDYNFALGKPCKVTVIYI